MSDSLQPYGPLRVIASDLFCVDGEWYDSAFRRRMTVVRLRDRSLVIHSAIRMREKDLAHLEELGPIGAIVIPNVFHDSEAAFYASRYPKARVFVPAAIRAKCEKRMKVDGCLGSDWPWQKELVCIPFQNTRVSESVFVHLASRTLIVTDLAFHVHSSDFKSAFERTLLGKWNGILDVFGPSRLTRAVFARDKASVGRALAELETHDFDRVIMNHGTIVETGGKEGFIKGYERIYGPFS